jgi:hypothetical protein
MDYKWLGFASLVLNLLLAIVCLVFYNGAGHEKVSYEQFLSIVLTALSIMLTVFGLLMAYVALIGRREIEERAIRAAEKKAEETIQTNPAIKQLMERLLAEMPDQLKEHLNEKVSAEGNKLYSDMTHTVVDLTIPNDAKEGKDEQ